VEIMKKKRYKASARKEVSYFSIYQSGRIHPHTTDSSQEPVMGEVLLSMILKLGRFITRTRVLPVSILTSGIIMVLYQVTSSTSIVTGFPIDMETGVLV
jgi:hypothetical protein